MFTYILPCVFVGTALIARARHGRRATIEAFDMGDNLMLAGCNVTANDDCAAELAQSGGFFTDFEHALDAVLDALRKA